MKRTKDLVTGCMVFLASFLYIINAFSVKVFSGIGATAINSRTVPLILGSCLMLLSVLMVIRALRAGRDAGSSSAESDEKTVLASWRYRYAVPVTFILLVLYVLLLKQVGFIPMTVAYLFFQILLLYPEGKKRYWLAAVVSLGLSCLIYLAFVYLLNVPLPSGIMPF